MKRQLWMVLGWLLLSSVVQAASFDCGKATTTAEKLICADAKLSKLDDELARSYKAALQDNQQVNTIRQAQKQWLKERNVCVDAACVKQAYEARLHGLSNNDTASTKHEAVLPLAQAKADVLISPPTEEAVCLAPKIDWRNYEWMLITGNDMEVCQEMLTYLKSRPADIAPPTCPEERLPPGGNWSRPESRILSEEEKQALLRDVPERWRQKKPGVGVTYEQQIRSTKLLRVLRGDITGDGIPESLLAFGRYDDYRQTCERSKLCARPEEIFKKGIVLKSDSYGLLPMKDDGTQVDWSHRAVRSAPMLMGGELIFYKGQPYWMTGLTWYQDLHDNFAYTHLRADDPYSEIFSLSEIGVGTGNTKQGDTPHFKDVIVVAIDRDPESNNVCRFGFFNHENLKQNPPKRTR